VSVATLLTPRRVERGVAAPPPVGAGLALPGTVPLDPLLLDLPVLVWADPREATRIEPAATEPAIAPERALRLRSAESPSPGARAVELWHDGRSLRIEHRVPTPEIAGGPGGAQRAAPGVAFVHWPLGPSDWERIEREPPTLLALGNARTLFSEGEPFVRAIGELRTRLGAAPVLWAPRVALPHRLALLTWLGVDALDTTEGLLAAARGEYLDPTLGPLPANASVGPRRSCECPACSALDDARALDAWGLARHTEAMYHQEWRLVLLALRTGRLRELVESRVTPEPLLGEVLRYADRSLASLVEERAPVVAPETQRYVLTEARRRPEIRRFVSRVFERYRPPPSKRVLLLVPCSKTKPYRRSPTHRRFARALEGVVGLERLHTVSITSPMGLVPRELEDLHPARSYDISVTGHWDEDERNRVRDALARLLSTGKYARVVAHLALEEYAFLRDVLDSASIPVDWTVAREDASPTASRALASLRAAVDAADLASFGPVAGGPLAVVREELEAIARVQFGEDAARRLFAPPVRLAGRPWFQRLTTGDGRIDLATWREERGLFQLTVAGGERIRPSRTLWVDIAPGFSLSGDLFVPGVREADASIRTGDAVVILRDERLVGVGEATLPGPLMSRLGRGRAAIVRHRARGETAASPTAT
jgi:archaeosine synthase